MSEKYGVPISEDDAKTASRSGRCPKCGAALTDGNPPICTHCGVKDQEGLDKAPHEES